MKIDVRGNPERGLHLFFEAESAAEAYQVSALRAQLLSAGASVEPWHLQVSHGISVPLAMANASRAD